MGQITTSTLAASARKPFRLQEIRVERKVAAMLLAGRPDGEEGRRTGLEPALDLRPGDLSGQQALLLRAGVHTH